MTQVQISVVRNYYISVHATVNVMSEKHIVSEYMCYKPD